MATELVKHTTDTAPQMALLAESLEGLNDPVLRRDTFEQLSGEDFIDLTQRVANIVRGGEGDELQSFDGTSVSLMTHNVPDHRDKENLLRETWQTAQELLHDRSLSDEDALEYAALTVAGGLLLAHPFADGNGRTSRALSFMISAGGTNTSDYEKILGDTLSGHWQVAPPSQIREPLYYPTEGDQPKKIDWEFQFAGEGQDALGGQIVNSFYAEYVVRKFIAEADETAQKIAESCSTRDENGELVSIDGDKFLQVLTSDPEQGIGYGRQLLAIEREVRAQTVRRFLDAMRSRDYGLTRSFKEFELKPQEGSEDFNVRVATMAGLLGSRAVDGRVLPRDEVVAKHRGYSHYYYPPDQRPK